MANLWNDKNYEFSYCLHTGRTEIDSIIKCLEMVRKNDMTAIYGTGLMGKRMLDILGNNNRSKIIFCDRKAEKEEYRFADCRVIPPQRLVSEYKDKAIQGIIISTVFYAEEVLQFLVMNGVKAEDILWINSRCGIL